MVSGAGDVQISGGGAVAVDTGSLRAAADRFRSEARQLQQLAAELGWCAAQVLERTGAFGAAASEFVLRLDEDAGALSGEADRIAGRLTEAAALYEVVEQRVALEQAESQGDGHATAAAHARIGALLAEHPGIDEQADALLTAWRDEQTAQMEEIALELLPVGVPYAPVVGLPIGPAGSRQLGADVAALVAGLGFGKMRPGTTGAAPGPVTVRQLGAATAGRAPRDLTELVGRIPDGERGLVRVERYTMPDGTRRYAAYIRGTRDGGFGGTDPSNMTSNLKLYQHETSTSYQATARALAMAGAGPGDTVDLVGHSQGGMIAGRLALDGGFRTELLVTAGSPTEAQVSDDVLSVQLRHDHDIVANLTAGGSAAPVGSDGSVVIRRDVPLDDGPLSAHGLGTYDQTARLAEASGDPQLRPVHDRIAELGAAVSVEVLEYDATVSEPPHVDPPPPPGQYWGPAPWEGAGR